MQIKESGDRPRFGGRRYTKHRVGGVLRSSVSFG